MTNFNPYLLPPPSASTSDSDGGGFMQKAPGLINKGLAIGSAAADDIAYFAQRGQREKYQGSAWGDAPPMYDSAFAYNNYKGMMQEAKDPMKIAGSAVKYAGVGAKVGGPIGAVVGGAVGIGVGIAKRIKGEHDANKYQQSMVGATNEYNNDLNTYNVNQQTNEVNQIRQQKYSLKNPYMAPSGAYWY